MSLTLERIPGAGSGTTPLVIHHPNIDDRQPDAYYEPGDVAWRFDRDEWEQRYWSSGDTGLLVRKWKHDNAHNFYRGLDALTDVVEFMRARRIRLNIPVGILHLAHLLGGSGDVVDYGLVSTAVVTDVGCQKIVAFLNTSDTATGQTFKYHGFGTGTTAEAAGDTALVTELTTEYAVDSTRPTGSQTTGATTKVYRSVGTLTADSGTPAVTEHGLFSASSAGSLFDRSKFSALNLVGANGDGIQATYDGTFTSGG